MLLKVFNPSKISLCNIALTLFPEVIRNRFFKVCLHEQKWIGSEMRNEHMIFRKKPVCKKPVFLDPQVDVTK